VVWRDVNGDGVRAGREPGIADVSVALYDGSGHVLARTRTAADGSFLFGGLPAGVYAVGASNLPDGLSFTVPSQGNDHAVDSAADPVTGRTPDISVADGQSVSGVGIGLTAHAVEAVTGASSTRPARRVLPAPDASFLSVRPSSHSTLSLVVLMLAALLASSLLLGIAWPLTFHPGDR
jgi:hypothetical protein